MKPIKLTEADRGAILAYIAGEPEMNLFIYGDLENYGVEKEPVSVYAFMDESGAWDSLLLRYFDSYVLYSPRGDCDVAGAGKFLASMRADCVGGKRELVERLAPYFPEKGVRASYLCRCNAVKPGAVRALPQKAELRRLGEGDVDAVVSLLATIAEFSGSYGSAEEMEKSKARMRAELACGSLVYGVFEEGLLAACACTNAANSQSAMVTNVAARAGFRNRGYASAAVAELCRASFREGKRFLCLFYNNPDAGRIYRRLGFEEVGGYAMLS